MKKFVRNKIELIKIGIVKNFAIGTSDLFGFV